MGSDPENPGLVLIHKGPDTRAEQYENAWHCDTTWRECAAVGAVLRCTAAPEVGGDMMWANMALAYERLPEQVKAQHRQPARPPQHRGDLRRGDADRQAPRAEGAVPRRRAPGGAHPPGDRREGAVRQRLHDALHQLPHARERALRPGLHARRPGAAAVPASARPSFPSTRCAGACAPNTVAIWDNRCTQHYAVQDFWPAVRNLERAGIIGDRPH